ncbi:MAG: solute:sodium symporter family transporter [Lentisphaeria bacterium]|nr:solute:sodium symporter family transporter [Lentisphaeria bacterium]
MYFIMFASFIGFTGAVAFLTWLIVRKKEHDSLTGYFLAGRSLTFPFIAGSLLLTNLSTEQMVGLNGSAFAEGLAVMAWEILAVIALVVMALFFLPRFLRAGVTTVPQYLALRFDRHTGTICNIIFLLAYTFGLLPIILYTGATGLNGIFNISSLTGISNESVNLWGMIWFVGIIGAIYALFGGLRSVAVSDTLNGIGLLIGGFMIVYFALNKLSDGQGIFSGLQILHDALPERFNSIGKANSSIPFSTLFTGVLIINLFYWCTNQQIIQRTFGASSLAEGQKGVLLCGLLKLFGPLYLVIPGIIAYYLFRDSGIKPDLAYGKLVHTVLPAPLTGFFAAVMVGAILSSFNSALNSACTLFSLGIYKELFRKNASEHDVVRSGKIFGWIVVFASMIVAPLLAGTTSIFTYLQYMNTIYFIPIFAVVLTGMLTCKVPAKAANTALIVGCILMGIGLAFPVINPFHYAALIFLVLVFFMWICGKLSTNTAIHTVQDAGAVDMTPWEYAPHCGLFLFLTVIIIYTAMADF